MHKPGAQLSPKLCSTVSLNSGVNITTNGDKATLWKTQMQTIKYKKYENKLLNIKKTKGKNIKMINK